MSKTMAIIDIHITYRCTMQTINGGICRERRLHLTCARFAKTKALDSQTQSADSSGVRRYDSGRRTQVIRRELFGFPMSSPKSQKSIGGVIRICHVVVGTSAFIFPTGVTEVPMFPKRASADFLWATGIRGIRRRQVNRWINSIDQNPAENRICQ